MSVTTVHPKLDYYFTGAQYDAIVGTPNPSLPDSQLSKDNLTAAAWHAHIDKYGKNGFDLVPSKDKKTAAGSYHIFGAKIKVAGRDQLLPVMVYETASQDVGCLHRLSKKKPFGTQVLSGKSISEATVLLYPSKQYNLVNNDPTNRVDHEGGKEVARLVQRLSAIEYQFMIALRPDCDIAMAWCPISVAKTSDSNERRKPYAEPFVKFRLAIGSEDRIIKQGPNTGKAFDPNTKIYEKILGGGAQTTVKLHETAKSDVTRKYGSRLSADELAQKMVEHIASRLTDGSNYIELKFDMSKLHVPDDEHAKFSSMAELRKVTFIRNAYSEQSESADIKYNNPKYEYLMKMSMANNPSPIAPPAANQSHSVPFGVESKMAAMTMAKSAPNDIDSDQGSNDYVQDYDAGGGGSTYIPPAPAMAPANISQTVTDALLGDDEAV
jgi:hypothetical protein